MNTQTGTIHYLDIDGDRITAPFRAGELVAPAQVFRCTLESGRVTIPIHRVLVIEHSTAASVAAA